MRNERKSGIKSDEIAPVQNSPPQNMHIGYQGTRKAIVGRDPPHGAEGDLLPSAPIYTQENY